ncbi:VOC family protein [Streptomyces sp. A1499]|uniref:VOC family protein n=1 Tax=Streptomyces sp. A1499 TaxID=2563104 RepID=UPI00109EB0F5|nr:VOC family protein [Streptomyces sp. A1499]THC47777.1 VOC family protein [Streptomyces sp. A1499]
MDYAERDTGDEYAEGVPCWADAMLPDVEGGKRFYGELFGWTFDEGAGPEYGHYTQAYVDGRAVAALAPKADGRMPTVWTVYLATPDAAALAGRIKAAGGSMVTEAMAVGSFGTMGLAADPEGAVFGLWQAGTHRGFGLTQAPGAFCWTEVYSRDKDRVDPFYEGVFGYRGHDLDLSGVAFRTWSPAGSEPGPDTAVGGRQLFPAAADAVGARSADGYSTPEMPPHFLVYFTVADADATTGAATRLGGRALMPPTDIPYGRMSVIRDNQGAVFAVLQD